MRPATTKKHVYFLLIGAVELGQPILCCCDSHSFTKVFMALEQDGGLAEGYDEGRRLLLLHCLHLGDSRVVECTHQTAKDSLRDTKHFQRAVTSRMAAVLHSPALKQRKLNAVQLPVVDKVQSGQWSSNDTKGGFVHGARPEKHKLDKAFQRMMLPNRGRGAWPSPTPASMFQGIASTEFVLNHLRLAEQEGKHLPDSWLSIICGAPGSIIANRHFGELVWVVAAAEQCFLAWRLKVEVANNGSRCLGQTQFSPCHVFNNISFKTVRHFVPKQFSHCQSYKPCSPEGTLFLT